MTTPFFEPNPAVVLKQAAEQNDRDWTTTVEIIREAVKSFGNTPPESDLILQKRCEALWQWAKVDNWTPPA